MDDIRQTIDSDAIPDSSLREQTIHDVLAAMPETDSLFDLAELFKMLGDSTRVRILSALSISELCVYDLSLVLGMERTAISHQLRLLRGARLVRSRREGKMVYYCIDDDHVGKIFEMGMAHIEE